jgi:predicted transcriptional regulator
MSETLSIRLDGETKRQLDALAKRSRRSKSFLAAEAIPAYVEAEEWQLCEIRKGLRELDTGKSAGHEKVSKWLIVIALPVTAAAWIIPSGISKYEVTDGPVFVPDEARVRYKGRKFLLKRGRLVVPYPANLYDMARDGAIEVERIEITEGLHIKGLDGWVQTNSVKRVLCSALSFLRQAMGQVLRQVAPGQVAAPRFVPGGHFAYDRDFHRGFRR